MTTNQSAHIYQTIRMANGKMTHLRTMTSSITLCGRWTGNTRQYATDEKQVTCKKCATHMMDYCSEAIAQGFTSDESR